MDYLIAIVTICVLSTQPSPDSHCHKQEIHSHHYVGNFGCEGIMDRKMFYMGQELRDTLKPWEMLALSYECVPIKESGLDQT